MMRIIAAVADDSAAAAVLATSNAIAGLFSATVDALHVGDERAAAVAGAAQEAGVALRTVAGETVEELLGAAAADDVAAVVVGARGTPAGRPRAGSIAMELVALLDKPVAVVPPDAAAGHPIQSVLVPLDGTRASAVALQEIVELASNADLNIMVAHVREERELPGFNDHLPHEVRAWRDEFMARNLPAAPVARLELRVGKAHEQVLSICRRSGCDLVALGWSQDLGPGRAAVVRAMLAESPVPVLLTPARSDPKPVDAGAHARATPAVSSLNGSAPPASPHGEPGPPVMP